MMKKLLAGIAVLVTVGLLVVGFNFWGVRNLRGEDVAVQQPEFADRGVLLQVFAGREAPTTQWLFLGSSDPNVTMTVSAPPARGIYYGASKSSVRHDRPFEVRIHRRYLGVLWLPDKTVRFDMAREALPTFNSATDGALWTTFKGRLAGQ